MVEVRRRIFTVGEPLMIARIASRPGSRGIITSSKKNIGLQIKRLGDRFVAISSFARHLEAVRIRKHVTDTYTNDGMIVCDNDSNRSFHRGSSLQ